MIKHISILFCMLLCAGQILTQNTKGFHYQAVARDNAGAILSNTFVNLRFQIRQGSSSGTIIYQEFHNPSTNNFGLVQLTIGKGTVEVGNFSAINWSGNDYFLTVLLNGNTIDTTPLESVPYAKAATSMNLKDLTDVSGNAPGTGQVLRWNGTEWLPQNQDTYTPGIGIGISGNIITNTAPDVPVQISGSGATTVTGIYPSFTVSSTDNVNDADASTTNEIQSLSLSGNTLSLSLGGGSVSLAPFASPWSPSGSNIFYNSGNVGIGDNSPVASLTVGNGDKLQINGADGDISFSDDQGSIKFANSNGANSPMITMFQSGTNNSTRMLLSHSPSFTNWGIEYNDTSDAFTWIGDNLPVFQVQLAGQQRIGVGTSSPSAKMHILSNSSAGAGQLKLTENQFDYSRLTLNNNIHNNFWDIAARTDTNLSNAQLNFFHSDAGDIITVSARKRVGINDTSPGWPLEVNGNGETRAINLYNTLPTTTSATFNYGLIANLAQATNTGTPRLFNVYGFSTDSDAYLSYGVYGFASNASNFNYGLYGVASIDKGYAVYASGNVFTTASYLPSDTKFKTGIRPFTTGLAQVMALKPKTYTYDTRKYDFMNFPEGKQYGFLAQDMEELLPELTKRTFQAYEKPLSDAEEDQGIEFKALNYTALIPLIVSAMQEQQQIIEKQEKKIATLEARLANLESLMRKN